MTSGAAKSRQGMAVIAGLISGLITLTYSLSYAALIFKGPFTDRLDIGIGMALISAIVVAALVAFKSTFPFAIAGPDSNASAILALMAVGISKSVQDQPESLLPTLIVCLVFSSLFVGASLFAIGRLKLGHLVRFIPYPVLGGFLAGTGWLITKGAFGVSTSYNNTSLNDFTIFTNSTYLKLWVPSLILAIMLMLILSRFKHFLVFPSLLIFSIICTHIGFKLNGMSIEEAQAQGWLFESFKSAPSMNIWGQVDFGAINWISIFLESGSLLAMTAVVIITILLNATGIELSSHQDADLNRELEAAGIANFASGIFGGIIGYLSISRSLLNHRAGGSDSRWSGYTAALLCVGILLFGSSVIVLVPKLVLGGLLFYLGIGLLREWVVEAFFKFSRLDYALVVGILIVIASMGFLEGVGFGLVISVVIFAVSYSRISIIKFTQTGKSTRSSFSRPLNQIELLKDQGDQVYIMNLQGYLFFGTANALLEEVKTHMESIDDYSIDHYVILDFRLVTGVDSSVTQGFQKLLIHSKQCNVKIFLTDLSTEMKNFFESANLIGEDQFRVFPTLDYSLQWCEDQMLESHGLTTSISHLDIREELQKMFLKEDQIDTFLNFLTPVEFKKGDHICKQGDPAHSMFFIESGRVTAQLELPGGKTIRLITMGPGTVFGEMGLYTDAPRSAAVITDKDATLYELSEEQLARMQIDAPEMATALHRYIIRLLAERIAFSNLKVQHLMT